MVPGPYYNTGPNTGTNLGDPKRDHNFDNPPHVFLGEEEKLANTAPNKGNSDGQHGRWNGNREFVGITKGL